MVKAIPQRTGFPTLNREGYSWVNKEALQVTKEIIVKFIETQRISPSNFAEHFPAIYKIVLDTLEDNATQDDTSER